MGAEGFTELTEVTTPDSLLELNRMFRELYDTSAGDNETVRVYSGVGTPEANIAAGIGSLYLRTDGGTDTSVYRKESGTGNTGWVAIVAPTSPHSTQFKIGSFTRDISLATGTQDVTGLGFDPELVIPMGGQDNTAKMSIGLADGTSNLIVGDRGGDVAGTWNITNPDSILMIHSGGNVYTGDITMITGGFRVSWTKIGAPSGTVTIHYLALRVSA